MNNRSFLLPAYFAKIKIKPRPRSTLCKVATYRERSEKQQKMPPDRGLVKERKGRNIPSSWFLFPIIPVLCQWNLDSGLRRQWRQWDSGVPWAEFWISKPTVPDSTGKNFPDSGIRIPLHVWSLANHCNISGWPEPKSLAALRSSRH